MASEYLTDPIYVGDSWPGIPAITFATPPAARVASARILFFKDGMPSGDSPATGTKLTSEESKITIVNDALWSFVVPAVILPLEAGIWNFRFKTADATGFVQTWMYGTLTII